MYYTDEENMPHMVTPELGDPAFCQQSYSEFSCNLDQIARVRCNIGMSTVGDPLHEKYDRCIFKVIDLTTNKEVYKFDKRATAIVQRDTTSFGLIKGHRYSCSALTNCFNASGYLDVTYNVKRDVPLPHAGKRIFSYFGLRIKEIINYDSNNEILSHKMFSYMQQTDTTRSSGYLANQDSPRYILEKQSITGKMVDNDCEEVTTVSTFFYDKPLTGLTPDNLYYEYVQVKDISTCGNNGITKYQFRTSYDESFGIQVPLISKEHSRGQLLTEQIYDNMNNKIEEVRYYYGKDSRIEKNSRGFKLLNPRSVADGGGCSPILNVTISLSDMYIPVDYSYQMDWYRQDSIVKYEYRDISNPIKTTTFYSYDDIKSCSPTKITVATSMSPQKFITITKYPTQLSDPVSLAMTDKNFISQYISKEKLMDNKPLTKQTNKYSLGTGTTVGLFLLDSILIQNGTMPAEKEININKYNGFNNILQYETRSQTPNTYLWGYKNMQVVAELKNMTYTQVVEILGQDLINRVSDASVPSESDMLVINALRNNTTLKDVMITTYTYKPLVGMTSMTDPTGLTTYYSYDSFGRLNEIYFYKDNIVKTENKCSVEEFEYHYKN